MALTPRFNLDESFPNGLACAVCGATSLKVSHLKSYPDFVVCGQCGSGFVVEDGGEHVLYGNISESYPHARELALRRWALPEDVAEASREDRGVGAAVSIELEPEPSGQPEQPVLPTSAGVPIPSQPEPEPVIPWEVPLEQGPEAVAQEPEPARAGDQPPGRLSRLMSSSPEPMAPLAFEPAPVKEIVPEIEISRPTPPAPVIETRTPASPQAAPKVVEPKPKPAAPRPPAPARPEDPSEPPVGQRSRVVIKGEAIQFPGAVCAHCLRSPAGRRLTVVASTPHGQGMGQRQTVRFNLPLCASCYRRATARGPGERAARVQAHLIAALIALGVLVASLALNIVNPDYGLAFVALILLILLTVGYALPAMVLLGRVRGFPVPPDAAYVRTTLLIPGDIQGLETPFEWRNTRYAERFYQANQERVLGTIAQVKDRAAV